MRLPRGRIFDTTCVGLPAALRTRAGQDVAIDPRVARVLQESANAANGRAGGR